MPATISFTYGCAVATSVTFDLYYEPSANGGGGVGFAVTSTAPVDGYFTVYFTWFGELGSSISQSLTIGPSGTCASNSFSGAIPGENVFSVSVDSFNTTGSQTFVHGSNNSTYSLPC